MSYNSEFLEIERDKAIAQLAKFKEETEYYDEKKDRKSREEYYQDNKLSKEWLTHLLKTSHTRQVNYSPHRYLYPWIDLQEDGQLKSLYSGERMDPAVVIEEDIRVLELMSKGIQSFEVKNMILNCEHVVPQSWFSKKEPMRGDLHHLFSCEPSCNSSRGNYPYHDFTDYVPEINIRGVKKGCGKAEDGKFEPEYGKGIVARATLYFLLRYQGIINEDRVDIALLLDWHHRFPVNFYEKHRNQSIFEVQGNRNPYIDFPEMAEAWM